MVSPVPSLGADPTLIFANKGIVVLNPFYLFSGFKTLIRAKTAAAPACSLGIWVVYCKTTAH